MRIITDTGSDITFSQAAQMDVDLVPLQVSFGEDVPYSQADDEDFSQFYTLLGQSKNLPVTSQPAPGDFLPAFERAAEEDGAVVVLISGKLSGTVQCAHIAREMCGADNIYIVDTNSAITGQRMLVDKAVQLRQQGLTAAEIATILAEMSGRIRILGALDTLKYLRRGGRIPKTTELLGTALGIKPVVELKNGVIEMAGKARGHAGAMTTMVKLVEENPNFDSSVPVYFGYTQNPVPTKNLQKLLIARHKLKDTRLYPVGATIGTHIGPGAMAITYLTK